MKISLIDRNKDTDNAYRLSIYFFQTYHDFLKVLTVKDIERLITIAKYPSCLTLFQALF